MIGSARGQLKGHQAGGSAIGLGSSEREPCTVLSRLVVVWGDRALHLAAEPSSTTREFVMIVWGRVWTGWGLVRCSSLAMGIFDAPTSVYWDSRRLGAPTLRG